MAGIVLATDWLVPAMIVHALIDANSGTFGYWILRDDVDASPSDTLKPSDAMLVRA